MNRRTFFLLLSPFFLILSYGHFFVSGPAAAYAEESEPAYKIKLHYSLEVKSPKDHLFEVRIRAEGIRGALIDFSMPAWSPGRYVIFDFTKNIQEFVAADQRGVPLQWFKLDKQTWRVECRAVETLEISYKVYANDLSGTFSQLNEEHANYNGASVFMYVVGHKQDPINLTIIKPIDWKLINGAADSPDDTEFRFDNYDLLIDTPTEMGNFQLEAFLVDGRIYRVALHSHDKFTEMERLVENLKQIVAAQTRIFGTPDFKHYTFLLHLVPLGHSTDGMEHLNSTQVIENDLEGLIETSSHEFFHVWNVKRIRPAGLGPWDYSKEVYTKCLWISEGLTSYYGNLSLARSGVWTRPAYYQALAHQIQTLQNRPGRKMMSLENSSWDTWLFLAAPKVQYTNLENTTISYYNKGQLVGLLLDLEIRWRTKNRKCLDDVFRYMYDEFYARARTESYYLKGRGFGQTDFLRAVNRVAGSDFAQFFSAYVTGTDELDYNKYLAHAGLKLEAAKNGGSMQIKELSDVNNEQRAIREAWLGARRAGTAAGR